MDNFEKSGLGVHKTFFRESNLEKMKLYIMLS